MKKAITVIALLVVAGVGGFAFSSNINHNDWANSSSCCSSVEIDTVQE